MQFYVLFFNEAYILLKSQILSVNFSTHIPKTHKPTNLSRYGLFQRKKRSGLFSLPKKCPGPLPSQSIACSHSDFPEHPLSDFCHHTRVLPVLELCINGITQYVLFVSSSFHSIRKKIIFRLIHIITYNDSFFFHCRLVFYYMSWFIYFPTNVHLDCFRFRIIINEFVK